MVHCFVPEMENITMYHTDGHNHVYIPKKNRELAEQLALKKFQLLRLKDCKKEKAAIDHFLNCYTDSGKSAYHFLDQNPEFQNLLKPYLQSFSDELSEWMNASYDKNPNYPHQLIHKTVSGNSVRSKSEALIDMFLHINQIPFRYEYALNLGMYTFYPDFTIRHPDTGNTFYWEHFGLMDNASYCKNAFSKLTQYAEANIFPGINLITTYETIEHPLTPEIIEKTITYYFK